MCRGRAAPVPRRQVGQFFENEIIVPQTVGRCGGDSCYLFLNRSNTGHASTVILPHVVCSNDPHVLHSHLHFFDLSPQTEIFFILGHTNSLHSFVWFGWAEDDELEEVSSLFGSNV